MRLIGAVIYPSKSMSATECGGQHVPIPSRSLGRQLVGRLFLACSILLAIAATVPGPGVRAASSADRSAGQEIFEQKGCVHCHGAQGAGTESGPSLLTVGKRLKKDEIERQIMDGGKQMPPFKDVLSAEETYKLVDYLAHKRKAPKIQPGG